MRELIRMLVLSLAALTLMGLQCGWGAPLEGLTTHCPPRTIDCGPGCIPEGNTCCDDSPSGGKSQCATAGAGIGKTCVKRGQSGCPPTQSSEYCCGDALGPVTASQDVSATALHQGQVGVFCGNTVIAPGSECCTAVDAKKLCRFTGPRSTASYGTGGGGGGNGTPVSCSSAGPGWMGSARSCAPLGAGGTCTCSAGNTNRCITKAEFDSIGRTFPAACKPSGQSGCIETASGTLIAPCCPGLTCKVGGICNASGTGGSCLQ